MRRRALFGALSLALLGLAGAPALAADPPDDKAPVAWSIDADTFLRYAVSAHPLPKAGGPKDRRRWPTKLQRVPAAQRGFLPSSLGRTGEPLFFRDRKWLAMALALQLPDQRVRRGRGYRIRRRYESVADLRAFEADLVARERKAPTTIDGLACRTFDVRGALRDDSPKRSTVRYQLGPCAFRATVHFHPRGHVLAGDADLLLSLNEPDAEPAKRETRLERHRYRFTLDLVLPLADRRLDDQVEKAIAAGVAFLKKKQMKSGNWDTHRDQSHPGGQAALCALALLASDVKADDPAVVKAMKIAVEQAPKNTYSVGCTLMAIEALHAPSAETMERLPHEQQEAEIAKLPGKLSAAEKAYVDKATAWLLATADRGKRWGYPVTNSSHTYDNSCSQYAALGLLSARRLGAKVPASIWREIVDHWLFEQIPSGPEVPVVRRADAKAQGTVSRMQDKQRARGWQYTRSTTAKARGSMTCAGIASLAIAKSELLRFGAIDARTSTKIDEALRDGWAWMQANFTVERHVGVDDNGWHYYYLYGLERAAVLTDVRYVGDRDWYREGAAYLVTNLRKNEGWKNDVNQTCFALLFLKRSTRPIILSK